MTTKLGPKPTKTFRVKQYAKRFGKGVERIKSEAYYAKARYEVAQEKRLERENQRLDLLIAKREKLAALEAKREKAKSLKPKKPNGGSGGFTYNPFG